MARRTKRDTRDIGATTGDPAGPLPAQAPAVPAGEDDSITGTRRRLCNILEFWRGCARKPCKRHRACKGDADACAIFGMQHVPERLKIHFRHALRHSSDGASPKEATRLADLDLAAYDTAMDAMPPDQRPHGWDWGRKPIPPLPAASRPASEMPMRRRPREADDTAPLPAPAMLRCRR